MLNSQNFVVFYSPFSCYCFLITNRRATGNVSAEMNSTHSTDSTGGSMKVNHTDVRMARTKVRGGLNLVYNLYEMNGWETQSDFSINRRQNLDPFLLATSRGRSVEFEFPSRRSSDEMHKAGKPSGKDYSL